MVPPVKYRFQIIVVPSHIVQDFMGGEFRAMPGVWFYPRPHTADFITRTCRGGGGGIRPPRFSKLKVVELNEKKKQRIGLDEYSRLVVRLYPRLKFDPVLGIKSQIFVKSTIFQLYLSLFQNL